MKVGFTSIEQNIYGAKKRKNIGFKATNSIVTDKKSKTDEKNSEEAAKRKKMIIAGTLTAVAVPATIAVLAMLGAKGKKKINVNSVAKIEKEITKNDLLSDSKEISKILKVFVNADKSDTKLELNFKNTLKVYSKLKAYNNTLYKIFPTNIVNGISKNLSQIISKVGKYIDENKKMDENDKTPEVGFIIDDVCKKYSKLALRDINNFMQILQKYDNMESVKNALRKMANTKRKRETKEPVQTEIKNAMSLNNDFQIKTNVINDNTEEFNYDFSEKNINNTKFVLDSQKKRYLIFDSTSDIIPSSIKKKSSGFIIEGMGDTRFFALALDDISSENILKMIKNEKVMKQFDSDEASVEAQDFLFEKLKTIDINTMIEEVANNEALESTQVIQRYVETNVIKDENEQEIVDNLIHNEQNLTMLLSSKPSVTSLMPQIIDFLIMDSDKPDEKALLTQELKQSIEKSKLKDKHKNIVNQLENIIMTKNLEEIKPEEIIKKYHDIYEFNKESLQNIDGNKALIILRDGSVIIKEEMELKELIYKPSDELEKIRDNIAFFINAQDGVINMSAFIRGADKDYWTEENISDKPNQIIFKFAFKDIQEQIKDIISLSDIFDLNILKPMLYSMNEALLYNTSSYLQETETVQAEKAALRESTKQKVSELLKMQDLKDAKEKLEELSKVNLESLDICYQYNEDTYNTLLNKEYVIDSNNLDSFMGKFILSKFRYEKPIYKEIVGLDGQKIEDIGFVVEDITTSEQEKEKEKAKGKNFKSTIESSYQYKLNDGRSYTITQSDTNGTGKTKKYIIQSSPELESSLPMQEITPNLVKDIEKDKALEALFVYNLNSKEKQKYFQAKIATVLKSSNWANSVQDLIHTMYSLDLLSHTKRNSSGNIIKGAYDVYKEFLEGENGNVLYINTNGQVLVNPNDETKKNCYVLSLG